MGLHDRDYYQRELSNRKGSPLSKPAEPTEFAKHFAKHSRTKAAPDDAVILRAVAWLIVVIAIVSVGWFFWPAIKSM